MSNAPSSLAGVRFWTVKQVAETGVSGERKLWQLINAGKLKHVRIGRAVRITDEQLREFIDANTKGGKS